MIRRRLCLLAASRLASRWPAASAAPSPTAAHRFGLAPTGLGRFASGRFRSSHRVPPMKEPPANLTRPACDIERCATFVPPPLPIFLAFVATGSETAKDAKADAKNFLKM